MTTESTRHEGDQPDYAEFAAAIDLPVEELAAKDEPERLGARRVGAKPGWYPFDGRLRWWDGSTWTNHWEKTPEKRWSRSAEVGMWLAVLIPFIGFLMGLALVAGRDRHAHWVVLTSLIVPVVVVLLLWS